MTTRVRKNIINAVLVFNQFCYSFDRHRKRLEDRSSIHTIDELSWDNSSHSSSFDLSSENGEVSIAIVLACRKIETAYEAIKILSDDIPADGSVRMV